ncbi:MAG: hypothetical protein Q8M86_09225 [Syntrophales bacterium]|nr:hypothetical protein [Syntrophales bacterium]MDP3098114.1 hypothetical protein [Syntrophales bacterium]
MKISEMTFSMGSFTLLKEEGQIIRNSRLGTGIPETLYILQKAAGVR